MITKQQAEELSVSLASGSFSDETIAALHEKLDEVLNIPIDEHWRLYVKLKRYHDRNTHSVNEAILELAPRFLSLRKKTEPWNTRDQLLVTDVLRAFERHKRKKEVLEQALLGHRKPSLSRVLYALDRKNNQQKQLRNLLAKLRKPFRVESGDIKTVEQWKEAPDTYRFLTIALDSLEHRSQLKITEWLIISYEYLIKEISLSHQIDWIWLICRCIGKSDDGFVYQFHSAKQTRVKLHGDQQRWFQREIKKRSGPYSKRLRDVLSRALFEKRGDVETLEWQL